VATPPPDPAAVAGAAEAAHWRLPAKLVVATWREAEPLEWAPLADAARPDGAARPDSPAAHGGTAQASGADLAAPLGPAAAGSRPTLPADALRGAAGGLAFAVLAAPAREFRAALDGHAAGIGPAVAPADAARSFRLAAAALGLAGDAPVAVDERRVALLCRAEPELVAELAAERLAPLAGETAGSRARLEATLLAWLRHAGTVAAAAAELGVHPQTVRYRLNRLRELFGDTLDDPDARFELELVLRA
jgi:hypothetical protein